MKIVGFLQNPWTGRRWQGHNLGRPTGAERRHWLFNLSQCASGKRLRRFAEFGIYYENASWVGTSVSGKADADVAHILHVLNTQEPDVVIAFGKEAEKALVVLWSGPLMVLPHPASRTLTNALYDRASSLLRSGFVRRAALRQRKGYVEEVELCAAFQSL